MFESRRMKLSYESLQKNKIKSKIIPLFESNVKTSFKSDDDEKIVWFVAGFVVSCFTFFPSRLKDIIPFSVGNKIISYLQEKNQD